MTRAAPKLCVAAFPISLHKNKSRNINKSQLLLYSKFKTQSAFYYYLIPVETSTSAGIFLSTLSFFVVWLSLCHFLWFFGALPFCGFICHFLWLPLYRFMWSALADLFYLAIIKRASQLTIVLSPILFKYKEARQNVPRKVYHRFPQY